MTYWIQNKSELIDIMAANDWERKSMDMTSVQFWNCPDFGGRQGHNLLVCRQFQEQFLFLPTIVHKTTLCFSDPGVRVFLELPKISLGLYRYLRKKRHISKFKNGEFHKNNHVQTTQILFILDSSEHLCA